VTAPFALVLDASATIPASMAGDPTVLRLPGHVVFGQRVLTPGIDLTSEEFYRLFEGGEIPSTLPPTVDECRDTLRRALAVGGGSALALTVAAEASVTHANVTEALTALRGERIEVVDTRSAASAIGLVATAVDRTRTTGGSFHDAAAAARTLAGNVRTLAVVESLEYLERTGRLSVVAALFGALLSAKPIVELRDGRTTTVTSVPGRDRALAQLQQIVTTRIEPGARIHAATAHTDAPTQAADLLRWLQSRYECVEGWTADAGPITAAHSGRGVVGLSWYRATPTP
jgi:DegV family protein with EDD domain